MPTLTPDTGPAQSALRETEDYRRMSESVTLAVAPFMLCSGQSPSETVSAPPSGRKSRTPAV